MKVQLMCFAMLAMVVCFAAAVQAQEPISTGGQRVIRAAAAADQAKSTGDRSKRGFNGAPLLASPYIAAPLAAAPIVSSRIAVSPFVNTYSAAATPFVSAYPAAAPIVSAYSAAPIVSSYSAYPYAARTLASPYYFK